MSGWFRRNMGHFIENLSNDEDLEVLEIFRSDKFEDFSLFQWLGETPKKLVLDHLFKDNKKGGEAFMKEVRGAEKDVIKSLWESEEGAGGEGVQELSGVR